MTPIASYGFLVFNLLCAPCFAAMGAIKREMNSAKWFWFAIGYQCILAYAAAAAGNVEAIVIKEWKNASLRCIMNTK